jgi:hypothetical protein
MVNLRDKRRARATDELVGERGDDDRRALRWGDLSNHPIVKLLLGRVQTAQETAEASGDTSAIDAEIDQIQIDLTQAAGEIVAAQATASAAQADANAALADAAAAQAVADAGAADWTTLKANYEAVTVTVDGSGYISGWRATTWGNLDGSGGGVLELLGDVIVPGTLATNKLTVGLQNNSFVNSDFLSPLAPNWITFEANGNAGAATSLSINSANTPYAWPSFPTITAYQNNGSTTGDYGFCCKPMQDTDGLLAPGWAVTEGERVSLSAQVSAHRCTVSLEVYWYDGSGVFISSTKASGDAGWVAGSNSTSFEGPVGSESNPDLWPTIWMLADAPLTAAYYLPVFRKGPSGSGDADSEMFMARPMHCRTHAAAVTFSPYNPEGSTLIDGSRVIASSITADKITVANLAALGITVGSADIEDAAIGSAQLAGTIQSENYVPGVSGWVIYKNGDAEFQDVIIREIQESDIADGAVTQEYLTEPANQSMTFTSPERTLATLVIPSAANNKLLSFHFECIVDPTSSSYRVDLWLKRGSTVLSQIGNDIGANVPSEQFFQWGGNAFDDGTYTVTATYASGSAGNIKNIKFFAQFAKK